MSLKALSYVSHIRSNLLLMERSPVVSVELWHQARSEFSSYLEKRFLIYPPSMLAVGLRPEMTFVERKKVCGLPLTGPDMSPSELEFLSHMESASRSSMRLAWLWRIGSECEDMRERGWFPFFVTLTVDRRVIADADEFWRDGVALRDYLKSLARVSARAAGHASALKDGASDRLFVRHVGVVEHGSSGEHPHMHLLIWMRAIPESWKVCPNRGIAAARSRTLQECRGLESLWSHSLAGLSPARYFRHEGDVWSALGFVVPVDRKKRRPIPIRSCRLAGVYLGKYMEKGDKKWLHRVKATRNLGKATLRRLLFDLPLSQVRALTWRPRSFLTSTLVQTMHNVPTVLLRSMAKQILFCRQWDSASSVPRDWTMANCGPFKAMLSSVRDGIRPHRMSLLDFYDWVTSHLPVPDGYCDKALRTAHLQLRFDFPPDDWRQVSHLGGCSR